MAANVLNNPVNGVKNGQKIIIPKIEIYTEI
jgi:hypothetical protein